MKFKTVYKGEKAIVINRNGEQKVLEGPKRVFLFLEKFEKLNLHVANSKQYLVIKYIDGKVEHKRGPITEWFNRFEHESINVYDMLMLTSSELILVYHRDPEKNEVVRRVCHGPCLFMPNSTEWLHKFTWHLQDPQNEGHLIMGGKSFQVLNHKPDFFLYHVNEVRTLDDTLITIKLMVIYELIEVFTMLDKTQDPISDFINAICADVVSYVAKLTFSEFLQKGANELNNLETFEQLKQRSARNGFKIESIIYNGYSSSLALQQIQDNAIHVRTQLRLDAEIDSQRSNLINLKLKNERECLSLEANLNKSKVEFEQKLLDMKAQFDLNDSQRDFDVQLKIKDLEQMKEIHFSAKKKEIHENYLKYLNDLGVDISRFEIENTKLKNKIDQVYELVY